MAAMRRIVVVGASLAGLRAVESARAAGFEGELVLVGEECRLPYDRPPLSKQVLRGEAAADSTALCSQERLDELRVEARLGTRARGLDLERRRLRLEYDELAWDGLVIATGCMPRLLPGAERLAGMHTLRTVDDAIALRADLERGGPLAVVGAGFIGGEVAASARALGIEVTILEALPAPLASAIGPELATTYGELHAANGVELRCGVRVEGFEGNGRVEAVRLADGSRVGADVAVVGIGVQPAVDWLAGSGLDVEDGVRCDETLAAAPGVYVAGDLARWPSRRFGEPIRVEHWTNAVEQGRHAARNLVTGSCRPYDGVPYFWSDQYGTRLQLAGRVDGHDRVFILADRSGRGRLLTLYGRRGRLAAVLAIGAGRAFLQLRLLLERASTVAEALDVAGRSGFVERQSA